MPYSLQLRFVQSVDRAEISPDKRMVIVRVRDKLQDDRNLVNAMMSFCSIGVVPQARQFLPEPMNAAINITMTRKLLNDLKHYSALQHLYDEVVDEADGGDIDSQADFAGCSMRWTKTGCSLALCWKRCAISALASRLGIRNLGMNLRQSSLSSMFTKLSQDRKDKICKKSGTEGVIWLSPLCLSAVPKLWLKEVKRLI